MSIHRKSGFFDPVIVEDGHTYERLAIEMWFESHDTSPLEGTKVTNKVAFPNQVMKKIVQQLYEENKSKVGK